MGAEPRLRSFEALKAGLDFEVEDFPLSVNARGNRAEAMSAINQEVAPERWPEWYAERRIDLIESGRRLEAFLRMREAPYFKAFRQHLMAAGETPVAYHQDSIAALRCDWEEMGGSCDFDDREALEEFGAQRPEHRWFAFMKREWEARTNQPLSASSCP